MGAVPVWCLVTLCFSAETRSEDVLAIALGITEAARDVGCRIAGGDVGATTGPLVVDLAIGGWVEAGRALRRDAGRPGETLVVTGRLGRAAAGLEVLRGQLTTAEPGDRQRWIEAQVSPQPRLAEGRHLLGLGIACCGDLSDGLLVDAWRTAAASRCGAEIWVDHLPVDPGLVEAAPNWVELAVGGGEDFELLAAVPEEKVAEVLDAWPSSLAPLSVVGRLVEGSGVRLRRDPRGPEIALPPIRSRHFGG